MNVGGPDALFGLSQIVTGSLHADSHLFNVLVRGVVWCSARAEETDCTPSFCDPHLVLFVLLWWYYSELHSGTA